MEKSAEEKLALAKVEILRKIQDCDDMILYYIRNHASKMLGLLGNRTITDSKIEIGQDDFSKILEFIHRLDTRGNLDYIPDVSKYMEQKDQLKKLLGILR